MTVWLRRDIEPFGDGKITGMRKKAIGDPKKEGNPTTPVMVNLS
jgi:hypothetical protein